MKPPKPTFSFKSFEEIKALLREKVIAFPRPSPSPKKAEASLDAETEEEAFREAMEGVTRIPAKNQVERGVPTIAPAGPAEESDSEPLLKLRDLVRSGAGFEVADTSEYIEGTMYQVPPEVARKLHRGDYSIQAYVNLHRMTIAQAQEVFEKFLKWAIATGKTGVLIVHGRGGSSPDEPLLKKKVVEWLTRGPLRKWIVAYASARSCDGGAGATYVLLRRIPASKKFKKPPDRGRKDRGKRESP